MKQSYLSIFVTITLGAILLSACGAGARQGAGSKVEADILVTGVIESINGTQWIVNGQTITVDATIVRDGTFQVGDTVKVEGNVQPDGTLVVTRVETPSAQDLATPSLVVSGTPVFDDNSNNANSNDSTLSDDNSNNSNINDDRVGNENSNDSNINDDNDNNSNTSLGDDNSNSHDSKDDNSNDDRGGQGGSDDNSNGG